MDSKLTCAIAAQELEAAAYDLVFMDIHMPVRALQVCSVDSSCWAEMVCCCP